MIQIPFFDLSSFSQEVTLDLVPYRLTFNWNSRGEYWTLDITNRDQTVLIAGIKIVIGYELLTAHPDRGLPPGELYAVDPSGNTDRIGQNDFFNNRVSLIYVPEAEL